jgi:hypothetical protein
LHLSQLFQQESAGLVCEAAGIKRKAERIKRVESVKATAFFILTSFQPFFEQEVCQLSVVCRASEKLDWLYTSIIMTEKREYFSHSQKKIRK